jgi:uncharacterized protein YjbI with pentapeptide repeats
MMELRKNRFHGYLRDGEVERFNAEVAMLPDRVDLEGCDLSNLDLRQASIRRADMRNTYLKHSDLRGVDLSDALLDGASINHARISGTFFPAVFHASEIRLSVEYGTRLRNLGAK